MPPISDPATKLQKEEEKRKQKEEKRQLKEEEKKKKAEEKKKKAEEKKKQKELEKKKKEMAKKMKAAATYKDKHKTVNLIVATPKAKGKEPKAPRLGGGGRGGGGGGGRGRDYSAAGLVAGLLAQQYGQQQYAASQAKNEAYKQRMEQAIVNERIKQNTAYGIPRNTFLEKFLKEKNIPIADFYIAQEEVAKEKKTKFPKIHDVLNLLQRQHEIPDLVTQYKNEWAKYVKTPEGKEFLANHKEAIKNLEVEQLDPEEFKLMYDNFIGIGYSPETARKLTGLYSRYEEAHTPVEKDRLSAQMEGLIRQELRAKRWPYAQQKAFFDLLDKNGWETLPETEFGDINLPEEGTTAPEQGYMEVEAPPPEPVRQPSRRNRPQEEEKEEYPGTVPPTSPLPSGTSGPPPLFPTAPEPAFPPPPAAQPIVTIPQTPRLPPLPPQTVQIEEIPNLQLMPPPAFELPEPAQVLQLENLPHPPEIPQPANLLLPPPEPMEQDLELPQLGYIPPLPSVPQFFQNIPMPIHPIVPQVVPLENLFPAPPAPYQGSAPEKRGVVGKQGPLLIANEPFQEEIAPGPLVPFGGGSFPQPLPVVPYAGPRTRGRGSRLNEPLTYYDPTNPALPPANIDESFIIPYEENPVLSGLKRTMRGDREPRQVEGQPYRAYHRVSEPIQEQLPPAFGGGGGGPQLQDLPELIFEGESAGGGGGGGGGGPFPMTSDY